MVETKNEVLKSIDITPGLFVHFVVEGLRHDPEIGTKGRDIVVLQISGDIIQNYCEGSESISYYPTVLVSDGCEESIVEPDYRFVDVDTIHAKTALFIEYVYGGSGVEKEISSLVIQNEIASRYDLSLLHTCAENIEV